MNSDNLKINYFVFPIFPFFVCFSSWLHGWSRSYPHVAWLTWEVRSGSHSLALLAVAVTGASVLGPHLARLFPTSFVQMAGWGVLGSRNCLTNHMNTNLSQTGIVYWAYSPRLVNQGCCPDQELSIELRFYRFLSPKSTNICAKLFHQSGFRGGGFP